MPSLCKQCGRPLHKGRPCDMARLSDGRVVHTSRIDAYDGDIRAQIDRGEVKVVNRFIKKKDEKRLA